MPWRSVTDIHFHEVGTMDAIADIRLSVCLWMNRSAAVIVSPVHVGSGHIRCAHGILPIPAPAQHIYCAMYLFIAVE